MNVANNDCRAARPKLLVFTRYPTPGAAKTRLIPALGADGAAQLHETMVRHTLAEIARLREASPSIHVEIRFTGGTAQQMSERFGAARIYVGQGTGDLGDRLTRAAGDAFASGFAPVLCIGTDCPELTVEVLREALARLSRSDVVLGPAADGGYYLIGMSRYVPELFRDMPWSTADVLARTVEAAAASGLTIDLLPTLRDVDEPADLWVWERARSRAASAGAG